MRRGLTLIILSMLFAAVISLSRYLPELGDIGFEQIFFAVFYAPVLPFVAEWDNLDTTHALGALGVWIAAFVAIDAFIRRRKKPYSAQLTLRNKFILLSIFFAGSTALIVSATGGDKATMAIVCGIFYLLGCGMLVSLHRQREISS